MGILSIDCFLIEIDKLFHGEIRVNSFYFGRFRYSVLSFIFQQRCRDTYQVKLTINKKKNPQNNTKNKTKPKTKNQMKTHCD